ncbi:MAG: sigma-E processing peptidase SpoIIGA [Clostridia bacterium]|nr:sigma-E processing peptidase SpoIIGA [Clostridia bacterium]
MEITVYIDVLFCTNFIFDFLLLWLCSLLSSCSVSLWRMIAAAAIGALYSVFSFFAFTWQIIRLLTMLLVGGLMCYLCFSPKRWQTFLRTFCIFLATAFLYGGLAFSFLSLSGIAPRLGLLRQNGILYLNLPILPLFCLSFICYFLLSLALYVGKRNKSLRQKLIPCRIYYHGKTATLLGLFDSGNLLQNPGDGKSVIIAQWSTAKTLFSENTYETATSKMLVLPYETLSGKDCLPVFLPEQLLYKDEGKWTKAEPVYVALVNKTLDRERRWNAILPHNMKGVSSLEAPKAEAKHQKKSKPAFFLAMFHR